MKHVLPAALTISEEQSRWERELDGTWEASGAPRRLPSPPRVPAAPRLGGLFG